VLNSSKSTMKDRNIDRQERERKITGIAVFVPQAGAHLAPIFELAVQHSVVDLGQK